MPSLCGVVVVVVFVGANAGNTIVVVFPLLVDSVDVVSSAALSLSSAVDEDGDVADNVVVEGLFWLRKAFRANLNVWLPKAAFENFKVAGNGGHNGERNPKFWHCSFVVGCHVEVAFQVPLFGDNVAFLAVYRVKSLPLSNPDLGIAEHLLGERQ